jgi:hypothetical protein
VIIATATIVGLMFFRVPVLKIVLHIVRSCLKSCHCSHGRSMSYVTSILQWIREVSRPAVIFFAKRDTLSVLNKAVLYVRDNEDSRWIRFVHVYHSIEDIPSKLIEHIRYLDLMYPKVRPFTFICYLSRIRIRISDPILMDRFGSIYC